MSAPRKQYRKGDPARNFAADDYNAIAAEVERWSNLKAIAPLAIGDGPGGRYLTRDGEPSFYAKLTGASSPYAWTEQVETGSGVWANGERSGTDAYEVNNRASLNNKIARLYPTSFDHRFRHATGGGSVGPCLGTITVTVYKCGTSPAQNEPIQILSGAVVVASGTTSSAGTVSFTGLAMGSYTVKYNDPSNPQTSGVVLSVCGATVTASFVRMFRMSAIISSVSCFGPSGSTWSIAGTGSYTAGGTIPWNSAAPSPGPIQQDGTWVSWVAGIDGTYTLTVDGVPGATSVVGCTPTDPGSPTISGATANNELCPGYVGSYAWPASISLTMSGANYTVGAGTYTLFNSVPAPTHYTATYSAPGIFGGTCFYLITFDAQIPTYCTPDPGYGGALFLGSGTTSGGGFCYGANPGTYSMLPAGPHAACPPFGTLTATGAGYSITITGL